MEEPDNYGSYLRLEAARAEQVTINVSMREIVGIEEWDDEEDAKLAEPAPEPVPTEVILVTVKPGTEIEAMGPAGGVWCFPFLETEYGYDCVARPRMPQRLYYGDTTELLTKSYRGIPAAMLGVVVEDGTIYCFALEGTEIHTLESADAPAAGGQWKSAGGKWYYYGADGSLELGWQQIGGVWYHLDETTGAMSEGWYQSASDGQWYYLTPASGAMVTGWLELGGKWYYLDPASGAMYANRYTPDYCWVNGSGEWVP